MQKVFYVSDMVCVADRTIGCRPALIVFYKEIVFFGCLQAENLFEEMLTLRINVTIKKGNIQIGIRLLAGKKDVLQIIAVSVFSERSNKFSLIGLDKAGGQHIGSIAAFAEHIRNRLIHSVHTNKPFVISRL